MMPSLLAYLGYSLSDFDLAELDLLLRVDFLVLEGVLGTNLAESGVELGRDVQEEVDQKGLDPLVHKGRLTRQLLQGLNKGIATWN